MRRTPHHSSSEHRGAGPGVDRDGGFSLVELLVVIVILGIIAAVTVLAVRGVSDRGDESSCQEDTRRMRTATEAYFAQRGGDVIRISDPAVAGETGTTPEMTLVAVGLLHGQSELHDVDADGNVSPQSGSRCA